MKRYCLIGLIFALSLILIACSQQSSQSSQLVQSQSDKTSTNVTSSQATENTQATQKAQTSQVTESNKDNDKAVNEVNLYVNGTKVNVSWEDSTTVNQIAEYAKSKPITVNSTRYGDFEQVGNLPQDFTSNDAQMTTKAGDIVLYSSNKLVVFFGSNSWSYTKLGHIDGLSEGELAKMLNNKTASIEIKWQIKIEHNEKSHEIIHAIFYYSDGGDEKKRFFILDDKLPENCFIYDTRYDSIAKSISTGV